MATMSQHKALVQAALVMFCVVAAVSSYPVHDCLLTKSDLIKEIGEHVLKLLLKQGLEPSNQTKAEDCADLFKHGHTRSGVYNIYPVTTGEDNQRPLAVYCDMDTGGGGWTVFQKRVDGSVDFFLGWSDYKNGFGNVDGEYWLGNDNINRLTRQKTYRLRVDLEDTSGEWTHAAYSMFSISAERTKYRLGLGNYSGTAGDSMTYHKSQPFSTKDMDNDADPSSHCAQVYKGAWWFKSCHYSNLNGQYILGEHETFAKGIVWYHGKGYNYSYKSASMKIRPVNF